MKMTALKKIWALGLMLVCPVILADSIDQKADALVNAMTPAEMTTLTHGMMAIPIFPGFELPEGGVYGSGFVAGIPRLGIPPLTETDASLGVSWLGGISEGGSTPLPSAMAMGSTWNAELMQQAGAMIGTEAHSKGFNVLLAGGVNLVRDPRNGRNFEYFGEDPLHSGVLAGAALKGIQSQHVISTLKHFAVNAQETGRHALSSKISDAAARESDLLAFQIAIEEGKPGSVMCAYNRVNGDYACENPYLLNKVLKEDWQFPGWAMSDWGATHGVDAALAGLDQQSGSQIDKAVFFGEPLQQKITTDPVYAERVRDMNKRILHAMLSVDVFAHPPVKRPIDFDANARVAAAVAEEGIVLLKNRKNILPLDKSVQRIAVIGGYADTGVLSGGGSSQVAGENGPAALIPMGGSGPLAFLFKQLYHRSPPLAAIQKIAPDTEVNFNDGRYLSQAVELAEKSDVVIVFGNQWVMEGYDLPDLSLPSGQDALISAVAKANKNTIVVLETGGQVQMPWLKNVSAVLAAWYPGARGGDAIAKVIFGEVNPSGHLPVTFPATLAQLPRPVIPGKDLVKEGFDGAGNEGLTFDVDYDIEGSDVGYRWFARTRQRPLFSFGYGLSYTDFEYSNFSVSQNDSLTLSASVTNTGARQGKALAQFYVLSGPNGVGQRLLGWFKPDLKVAASETGSVVVDPRLLATWDEQAQQWHVAAGRYVVALASSADDIVSKKTIELQEQWLQP